MVHLVCSLWSLYLPRAQLVHSSPASAANWPYKQLLHEERDFWPTLADFPAGHVLQRTVPVYELYWPAAHNVHAVLALSVYLPAPQSLQLAAAAAAFANFNDSDAGKYTRAL